MDGRSSIYRIADLTVEIPAADGLAVRCRTYKSSEIAAPDIIIDPKQYIREKWSKLDDSGVAYMESAYQFYLGLIKHGGIYLHSSAIELDGKAYLFSGPSGVGKSTHTRLWQQIFGERARVFNDDKPALRCIDGRWYAYGTPWCGKDGININMKTPLAGICFLKQGHENRIRRLSSIEALPLFLTQTLRRRLKVDELDMMLTTADRLLREIPIFELENRPEPAAAQLSYETMRRAAEEAGL